MAKIKNLLKESILLIQQIKLASALTQKDRLLNKITLDLKKRLNLDEIPGVLEDDEFIDDVIGDEADPELAMMSLEEDPMLDDLFTNDELLPLEDPISELDDPLIPAEDPTAQPESDLELDDIIQLLESEDDDGQAAYSEAGMETDPLELDDTELMERIKLILEGLEPELELGVETILECDEGEELPPLKPELVILNLKKANKALKLLNQKYHKNLQLIQKLMNETKCIQMKGNFALKLFERYSLTKAQKMTIILNFDRANNERLIKLIYATLRLGLESTIVKKPTTKKPVSASQKMKSTKTKIKENRDHLDSSDLAVSDIFKRRSAING